MKAKIFEQGTDKQIAIADIEAKFISSNRFAGKITKGSVFQLKGADMPTVIKQPVVVFDYKGETIKVNVEQEIPFMIVHLVNTGTFKEMQISGNVVTDNI